MAYQLANGDSGHALGQSVDEQMKTAATLMTTFDNAGWQAAVQNVCQQQPGRNLPMWPQAIYGAKRPQQDKAPQQAISAQIAQTFGRPWNADQGAVDPGLFVPVAQMQPTPVTYGAMAAAQMGVANPSPPLPPPPKRATMNVKKPATATDASAPDAQCGFSDPGFSVWNIPKCMFSSLAGIPKSTNLFLDHSRYFYILCWVVVIIILLFIIKKIMAPPKPGVMYLPM